MEPIQATGVETWHVVNQLIKNNSIDHDSRHWKLRIRYKNVSVFYIPHQENKENNLFSCFFVANRVYIFYPFIFSCLLLFQLLPFCIILIFISSRSS